MLQGTRDFRIHAIGQGNWCVDNFVISESEAVLEISGWFLEVPEDCSRFIFNGELLSGELSYHERPDIDSLFGFFPKIGPRGFSICVPLERLDPRMYWMLSFGDPDSIDALRSYFGPSLDSLRDSFDWPGPDRRFRVHGSRELEPFILEGFSCAKKVEILAERYSGQPLEQLSALDWGCGCARVARWLSGLFGTLSGVDIDADNVAWCSDFVEGPGDWKTCELTPPMPFEAECFELVYGVSVFTHIAESAQSIWLNELERVLAPGGCALVSVHGPSSASRFDISLEDWKGWEHAGIWDLGPSRDLEAVFGEHEHYRGTLHLESYIREHWAGALYVEEVLPAVFGNHQDVVVLRKPEGIRKSGGEP